MEFPCVGDHAVWNMFSKDKLDIRNAFLVIVSMKSPKSTKDIDVKKRSTALVMY